MRPVASFGSQASFPCVAHSLCSHTCQTSPLPDCGTPFSSCDTDRPNQSRATRQSASHHRGTEGQEDSGVFTWGGPPERGPCLTACPPRRVCSDTCRRVWRRRSRCGRPESAPRRRSFKRYKVLCLSPWPSDESIAPGVHLPRNPNITYLRKTDGSEFRKIQGKANSIIWETGVTFAGFG